ncbi:MAG: diacylglycerol kinase family protein [Bacteroidales bacterium]
MERKKVVFIINPLSGLGRHRVVEKLVEKHIDKTIYDYYVKYISPSMNMESLARLAAEDGCNVVVAVGGDGSVNAVARGIFGTKATLGIIPVGSGNGLANFLGISLHIKEALEVLNEHHTMLIDTLMVEGERVLSIAGVGYDAVIAEKMKRTKIRGFAAYMRFAIEAFVRYKPKYYKIEYGEKKITTKALFIAFANSNQFGYRRPISPDAKIDDGLMNVCIVEKPPVYLVSWVGFNLFFHHHLFGTQYIKSFTTDRVKISQRKARIMNIDGEAVKMPKVFTIEVEPKSISVIVP